MTDFKDRERAFEAKFVHDADVLFRITARRNRLLGEWAAEKMGLSPEETDSYAKEVIVADFEEAGDEDVVRKLLGDMTQAGCDIDEAGVRAAIDEKAIEARRQFIEEVDKT
ncbi:MAG: DUF1476 domain-containing protein [Sphingomonadales bacterium]|nr:DUF1476 domain-containing protein [Sphingomonadales bacterium]